MGNAKIVQITKEEEEGKAQSVDLIHVLKAKSY